MPQNKKESDFNELNSPPLEGNLATKNHRGLIWLP